MEQRRLGATGSMVSAMGLGCMSMSDFYGPRDQTESLLTIKKALDFGITFFDTADIYGPFTNEILVGEALAGKRDGLILATKFGIVRKDNGDFLGINGRPAYVKKACDSSLRRLKVDCIDLYYQHRVDPQTPIEETVGAMSDLVQAGKVRYLGLSEAAPETVQRAHAVHPISALQTEYSLWSRDPENRLIDLCRDLGVAFVSYSPLGRGFLSGKIKSPNDLASDDWRRTNPRFITAAFQKNLELVERLEELAETKGVKSGQLALAWVLAQGEHIIPIPGTRRRTYLEENVGALKISLSKEDLDLLTQVFQKGAASGDRYPDMSLVDG